MLLAGPVGYRLGILPLRVALQSFLRWGAYGAIAATVVSLAGLVVTLTRPREARRGILLAAISLLTGVIEATDTTFWFGFKDDVVIHVRPADGGSRVDVRSLSRVGVGDAGTNAKRIRAYLDDLRVE